MATDPSDVAAPSDPEFQFEVGTHALGELAVLAFEAEEELSRPFSLEVTVIVPLDANLEPESLIGEKAALVNSVPDGSSRYFNGIVAEVKSWQEGTDDAQRRLRLRIVPTLWKLGRGRSSRIFQDQSVPDIVKGLLSDAEVEQRWELNADYPSREYCVQYNEATLDFISRLLEEVGISYFFEHAEDQHTLVLTDDPSSFQSLPGDARIVYREPSGMMPDGEQVDAFLVRAEVRPGTVTLRDFNYLKPGVDLTSVADCTGDHPDADGLEIYEYPAGFQVAGDGDDLAKIRLQELRVSASTAEGSGYSRRFIPGAVFELAEHPLEDLNGKYLLMSVQQRGNQEGVVNYGTSAKERYRNQFTCLLQDVPFRPERRTPRPVLSGPQTAIVVGPANEEIYCDAHGRVKVQFHWDRDGKKDDKSSCWMRVSQAWAGPGWGALYLPRIGQEVIVEFLEGDPDRPIVTGAVYNGLNPPPLTLPDDKTKSTLRSASSPGSDGANELRFEDAKGSEEVYLHAQKDLAIVIENDQMQTVGANQTESVGGDLSITVGGNQTTSIGKNDSGSIGGNQSLTVTQNQTTSVGGNQTESVAGDQSIVVGGMLSLTVGAAATEVVALAKVVNIAGSYDLMVGGAMAETIGGVKAEEVTGSKTEVVGGDKSETVGGSRSLNVGGDLQETIGGGRTLKIAKDFVVSIDGQLAQSIKDIYTLKAKELVFSADEKFSLVVGSAKLVMDKSGDITLEGGKIQVKASGDLLLKGQKISQN